MSSASFISRVREALPTFSKAERRLADTVLEFPGNLSSYSASELANCADVSNATVTRFVRRLGYQNYDEARRHVRAENEAGSPLFYPLDRNGAAGTIGEHNDHMQANLGRTLGRTNDAEIVDVAQALLSARKVWVIGFRNAFGLAAYFRWQLAQVLDDVTLLPHAGDALAEDLSDVRANDVAVVFVLRRQHAMHKVILDYLQRMQIRTVRIVNVPMDLGSPADWTFRCETRSLSPIDNHVSVLAICHLLATRTIELSDRRGRKRMSEIENAHDFFQEILRS